MMKLYDKRIFEEYKDLFGALAEYDRTGKFPKLSYKKRIDITIDAKLLRKLKEYCKAEGLKLSQFMEKAVRKELAGAH